jgi:glycyl-tRNA synthetase beta chain
VRDHYKPVGQGDEIPSAPVTIAVSLADKLDTISAFFAIGEKPTGSKDPFALRRAALGALQIFFSNQIRAPLLPIAELAAAKVKFQSQIAPILRVLPVLDAIGNLGTTLRWNDVFDPLIAGASDQANADASKFIQAARITSKEVLDFFADRLKVQQRDAGVRHDLIDAVFALGGEDDLVRLLARVHALQAFVTIEEGTNLLAGYKRAANILKKEGFTAAEDKALSYEPEPAESALVAALDSAEPLARDAVTAEDFEGAMAALASLRGPIDRFFDDVTVNDPDQDKRAARLALLARVRDAVHSVADFSKIEG